MDARIDEMSTPARLAHPAEGISGAELALATRNHGMPLEAMRHELTPPGLHYVLVHYDIPYASAAAWRLSVGGRVRRPLTLGMEALRERPPTTLRVTMECAGNGRARLEPRPVSQPWLVEAVGTAEWTGVPLRLLLEEAGAEPGAAHVVFTGADHGVERGVEQDYRRSLPLTTALDPAADVLVAYAMNGAPLPPQHGFPLRLIVPGWYGMAAVKWLRDIRVDETPFTGFQQTQAYRIRQEPGEEGEPVTTMAPRALLVPPGFPDFMSRTRIVRPGLQAIEGRAWSGGAPVTAVEVSTDDCRSWRPAELEPEDPHRWAWRGWTFPWSAEPGRHVLSARATDARGRTQPVLQQWNRGGFANNLVQRVDVVCAEDTGRHPEAP